MLIHQSHFKGNLHQESMNWEVHLITSSNN